MTWQSIWSGSSARSRRLPRPAVALLGGLALLVAACGGGAAPTSAPAGTIDAGQTAGPAASAPGPSNGLETGGPAATQSSGGNTNAIPADCAAGFATHLKLIEPIVATFDPSMGTFGDFFNVDEAASEQGIESLLDNDGIAPYSCSEVGLEFNFFDTRSPWPAIHEIAAAQAPGTVAYLRMKERVSAMDVAELADYGLGSCDDAVARIRADVTKGLDAGFVDVDEMRVEDGLALLGLYMAYLADVRDGSCPADALGNEEFGFMGAH